ncbi:MAG: right-handed parallel beta-helix repeat-containing protein [Phycisphaerales bacterium]
MFLRRFIRFALASSLAASFGAPRLAAQTLWYVDADATGANSGTSWADAFTDLGEALVTISPADEVWVAEGVYRPGRGSFNRSASFVLSPGLKLYGGFAGGETQLNERDWDANPTILSGDLRGDDLPNFGRRGENAWNVIRAIQVGSTTVVDGFTIQSGHANDFVASSSSDLGGGLYLVEASPTIRNCRFIENNGSSAGGAVYLASGSPLFENCEFIGNRVDAGSVFRGGGAMSVHGTPTVRKSLFRANQAGGVGGAIDMDQVIDAVVEDCVFEDNLAAFHGGAIYLIETSAVIRRCTMRNNETLQNGGALAAAFLSDAELEDSVIESNIANWDGGGLWIRDSLRVTSCVIDGNESRGFGGGGVYFSNDIKNSFVASSSITNNSASRGAGVLSGFGADALVVDTLIADNDASTSGGGIGHYDGGLATLVNCTVAGNTAPSGPGIATDTISFGAGSVDLLNSIVWNGANGIWNDNNATITAMYSCISGGWPGEGNIDADPLFIESVRGDYHLAVNSPCRNAGDDGMVGSNTDHEGDPRIAKGRVDMGADEFHPHLYAIGDFEPGELIDVRVVGEPGDVVELALGSGLLDEPVQTAFGLLYLKLPLRLRVTLGVIGPDGSLAHTQRVPSNLPPGQILPFQALIGGSLSNPLTFVAP